jgi:hypothetical protein
VVPGQRLAEVNIGEQGEDHKAHYFLDGFQLHGRKMLAADAVGGHLNGVFKEGDSPGKEDHKPQGFGFEVFEVAIPGVGHEDIAHKEHGNNGVTGHHGRKNRTFAAVSAISPALLPIPLSPTLSLL